MFSKVFTSFSAEENFTLLIDRIIKPLGMFICFIIPLFIYFLTRNSLLWAEIHLPLIERIRLYFNTLRELVYCICPPAPKFGNSSLKLSDMSNHFKIYKDNLINKYTDPMRRAKVWAITHYILRRFGDCSDVVRTLG